MIVILFFAVTSGLIAWEASRSHASTGKTIIAGLVWSAVNGLILFDYLMKW